MAKKVKEKPIVKKVGIRQSSPRADSWDWFLMGENNVKLGWRAGWASKCRVLLEAESLAAQLGVEVEVK